MGKSKGNFTKSEERRSLIAAAKKEEMLAVLIRNREAYEAANEIFQVADCRKGMGDHFALVWRSVRKFYKTYKELPSRTQLESIIHDAVEANPTLVNDDEREELNRFLTFAWDDASHGKKLHKSKTASRVALDTCKELMDELVAAELQEEVLKEGTLPASIPELLAKKQKQLELIQSMSEVSLESPFPEEWYKRKDNQIVSTGIPSLDALTGGGLCAKEVLLFMAPYGSCKTVVACASTAALIQYAAQLYATGKARKNAKGESMIPVAVLVFTESDKNEYRNRLMANLARIPWKRLREMTDLTDLSGSKRAGAGDATKYELTEFADKISKDMEGTSWKSERTRVMEAMQVANRHLVLIDCTDADDNQHKIGSGGMPEVANVVRGLFRKNENLYPVMIWVDHLSGLADRMGDMEDGVLRRVLTQMPLKASESLGGYFNCPIGLLHQLSGAVQGKRATAKMHHSDAEGAKAIGKYANFCVVSGNTDENLMCIWSATKHRREPPTRERIVEVAGMFSRLKDCTNTHGIEPGRSVIMPRTDMGAAGAMRQAEAPTAPDPPTGPAFGGILAPVTV